METCTHGTAEGKTRKGLPIPIVLQPGQVVILDNATFHLRTLQLFKKLECPQAFGKGGRIHPLIEQAGAQILYLQPYSPDLNKIENCWSWLHLSHS